MQFPPYLSAGDLILIVSPGKSIAPELVNYAVSFLEDRGFRVEVGKNALGVFNYFSGSDQQRQDDFQWALDHPEAKAILCARGGYGCVNIVEGLRWANYLRNPKWIAGFSDVTVLHMQSQRYDIASLHSTMPLNFGENSTESLDSLINALTGKSLTYTWPHSDFNKSGTAEGILLGGNFSILYSLLATPIKPEFTGAILFLEDVGEQLYHLDRMVNTLKLAGVLDDISGLIIGGMTDMKDTQISCGYTVESIVRKHLTYSKVPVAFGAPVGHIDDNRTFICGAQASLSVTSQNVVLKQIQTI